MALEYELPKRSWTTEKAVSCPKRETLALPITLRFTEYRAIMVRIPAKSAGIFSLVCRKPVIRPARPPAKAAAKMAKMGFVPFTIRVTATAAPRGKDPSTVMSATSSTRKVI